MLEGKIIGYDISNSACQISYYNEELQEPETFEASPENYQIPLVIGKRNDNWAIGIEAKRLEILHEGKLVDDLLTRSIQNEKVILEHDEYDSEWLLCEFIKRSLEKFHGINTIVFTVPIISKDIARVLTKIAIKIGIQEKNIYIQDYRESFCHYMFYQPKELWQYEAALFYCDKYEVRASMLRKIETEIKYTDNIFVTVDDIADATRREMDIIYPLIHGEKAREADARFKLFIENVFEQKMISSVYLTGEGFENSWYPESLKTLCNGRRAFMGNNLYSKGACYTAFSRLYNRNEELIYIDENKLPDRVCLKVRNKNEFDWFPLISWGNHWYECKKEWEFLLEDTEDIELYVESIYKGKVQMRQISLEGLPERDSYSTKLLVQVIPLNKSEFKIKFKDIGFGEFYESSGYEAEEIFRLGGNYGKYNSMSDTES